MIDAIEMIGTDIGWQTIAVLFCLIVTGVPSIIKGIDFLIDRFEIETKRSKQRKEQANKCALQAAAIKALEDKIIEYDQTNKDHWAVSKNYQTSYAQNQQDIIDSIKDLKDQLNNMQATTDARFAESEKIANERIQAELKDKILRLYRHYHKTQEIDSMEMDTLESLIKAYEKVGGNSFVHDTVKPEMYTWKFTEII